MTPVIGLTSIIQLIHYINRRKWWWRHSCNFAMSPSHVLLPTHVPKRTLKHTIFLCYLLFISSFPLKKTLAQFTPSFSPKTYAKLKCPGEASLVLRCCNFTRTSFTLRLGRRKLHKGLWQHKNFPDLLELEISHL